MVVRVRSVRWALLGVCLGLTALSFWTVDRLASTRSADSFEAITADSLSALGERLKTYRQALDGLTGLFAASDRVTRPDIQRYVEALDIASNLPGATGLGYIAAVDRADWPAFAAEAREDGVGDLEEPPGTGADIFVVKFIEPLSANAPALGLDIAFHEGRRKAAIAARDIGEMRITPMLQLVQGARDEAGFVLLHPVYAPALPSDTPEERRAALTGWTYAPLIGPRLLGDLTHLQNDLFQLYVFDGATEDPARLIYGSAVLGSAQAAFTKTAQISVFGQTWTVRWDSTPAFEAAQPFRAARIVALIGLFVTGLIYLVLRLIARNERDIRRQVAEKTRALKTSGEEMRSVIEYAQIGILTLTEDATVLRANDSAMHGMGREMERIRGHRITEMLPDFDVSRGSGKCHRPATGELAERIYEYRQSRWRTAEGELRRTILLLDVTEQENHLARIRETEKRWDLALKGAKIGVFDVDLTTGKSVVSDSWRRIMGVELDDGAFDPQTIFLDRVHQDDYPALKAADSACIRGETARSASRYRIRVGDDWRWMQSDATVVDWDSNGRALRFVGAQSDVTEQVEAQAALAASEERFRIVFFHAPVGKGIAEGHYRFTAVNDALCQFLGYSEEELHTTIRLRDVLSRADLGDLLSEIEARKAAGENTMRAEKQFIHRDGSKSWGLISISWMLEESVGEMLYIVQINDISETKEMARTKSEFVSTISHELRTPLTSIKGALELMASPELANLAEKRKRLMDIARQNADRLLTLVNDVLDLERIESRAFEFLYSDEDAATLLDEAREINTGLADKLGVTLEVRALPAPVEVHVDVNRFAQLIGNLITNACKFSEPEGKVVIAAESVGAYCRFTVTNRGPGIPDSFRPRLFHPFSQADGTDTRKVGGTGLGLSIARQIVERMGGEIGYTSVPGEETTFWFTCPRVAGAQAERSKMTG
ncbi:MAG: CHASE domain-containing protein [Pseudooceanicola sp.]|nr:CHASE domain-containing protein [Pseudooceanicola sp.]